MNSPTSAPGATARAPLTAPLAVGLAAGFLSGLFGVGGGILMVPGLVLFLHFEQRRAHGTSLAAVLPIAISSTIGYWLEDKIDWPVAACLVVGALAGAVIGTKLLHALPHRTLAIAFAALLVATAIRLLVDNSEAAGRPGLSIAGAIALVLVGVVSGILAGLLGVGGGIIMVPIMVVAFGIPAAVAKGTSLAVIVPTSIMGTWRNRKKRNADLKVAAVVGMAGVVSAFLGTKLSVRMSETLSNVLFSILLLVVAARMAADLIKERAAERTAAAAAQPSG